MTSISPVTAVLTGVHLPPAPPGLLHAQGNYFATADGTAVYLAGSHTWTSGISYKNVGPFDFGAYLNVLQGQNANLLRYWTWAETVGHHDGAGDVTTPLPFVRSNVPGEGDGGYKFDLTKFNQLYFDKLHADVQAAASKGVYVSVMLFFDADPKNTYQTWRTDYWNGANNINGTTTSNIQVEQGTNPATLALQKAYVAKVLDTLQDQSNVLYEIANEPYNDSQTVAWENTLVNFTHSYENTHGYMQHPVGITANYPIGNTGPITQRLMATNADWISPGHAGFRTNPPAATGGKVVIVDTDHVFGIGGDASWVWQQFTRGYNVLYMDDLRGTGVTGTLKLDLSAAQIAQERSGRLGIKETGQVSRMVDLTSMKPANALSSTGYVLADAAHGEYVVYSPNRGSITVNLTGAPARSLNAQWMNVANGQLSSISAVVGGSSHQIFANPHPQGVLILTPQTMPPSQTPQLPPQIPPPQTPPVTPGTQPNLTMTFDPVTHRVHITGDFVNAAPVLLFGAADGKPVGPGTNTGSSTIQHTGATSFSVKSSAWGSSTYQIESHEGGVVGRATLRIGLSAVTFDIHQADVVQDLLSGFRVGQDHLHVTDANGVALSSAADTALIAGATSDTHSNAVLHLSANHDVTLSGVAVSSLSGSIFT